MGDIDPTTVGGSTLVGSGLTMLGLWLRRHLAGAAGATAGADRPDRTAEQAHEEIDSIKERLTRIEGQLAAVRADGARNESGISALNAKLDTMNQAAAKAQIELATTLGRIEGEMRARRDRGTVTP